MKNSTLYSTDEWSSLNEVIVGDVGKLSSYHFDLTFKAFFWDNLSPFLNTSAYHELCKKQNTDHPTIDISPSILEELKEDIHGFCGALSSLGVKVRRPSSTMGGGEIRTPQWKSLAYPPLNVRDQSLILGNTLIETAPHVRGRIHENDALKPLFYEYFSTGANWVCMPQPALTRATVDLGFHLESCPEILPHSEQDDSGDIHDLKLEMLFDGAQCLRFGKDVLVNVATKSQQLGLLWLERTLGHRFNFHLLNKLTDGHIDSLMMPLREGVILVRHADVINKLPEPFCKWKAIEAPEQRVDRFPVYEHEQLAITSTFIDMNVLSVDGTHIIVNSLYPELASILDKNGFTSVPVQHRHRRLFGGGFHCFTLDVNRALKVKELDQRKQAASIGGLYEPDGLS